MHLRIYVDGASWGNPGPAAIGAVVKDEQQKELSRISRYIGESTNNQAEYQAVIDALKVAAKFEACQVTLYLDSELVAKQLAGRYKVRNLFLFPLYREAIDLSKKVANLSIVHIRHEENFEAHALAKAALNRFAKQRSQI